MNSTSVKIIFILALLGLLGAGIWAWNKVHSAEESYKTNVLEPYERYKQDLRDGIQEYQQKISSEDNIRIGSNGEVSTNNFEGPEVHIEALEYWGKPVVKGSKGVQDFSPNFVLYDPDHPVLGMPDFEVRVSPVTLYKPEKGIVNSVFSKFIPGARKKADEPFREYTKTIIPNDGSDTAKIKKILMQLWLTEFEVTISIRPDRKRKGSINFTDADKNNAIYPGEWYGQSGKLTATDLSAEPRNNRYGNIKLWLKVNPNNSPWYVRNEVGQNETPEMAIGAIYCEGLKRQPVENLSDIAISVGVGSELALYPNPQYANDNLSDTTTASLPNFESKAGTSVNSRNDTSATSIWNKPYYVKFFFKNIGSWKNSIFDKNRKYDDQLRYKFVMPVLVEGSWDMHPPYEIIASWDPPETFHKEGISLIPDFGLGVFGKIGFFIILIFVGLAVLAVLNPGGLLGRLLK